MSDGVNNNNRNSSHHLLNLPGWAEGGGHTNQSQGQTQAQGQRAAAQPQAQGQRNTSQTTILGGGNNVGANGSTGSGTGGLLSGAASGVSSTLSGLTSGASTSSLGHDALVGMAGVGLAGAAAYGADKLVQHGENKGYAEAQAQQAGNTWQNQNANAYQNQYGANAGQTNTAALSGTNAGLQTQATGQPEPGYDGRLEESFNNVWNAMSAYTQNGTVGNSQWLQQATQWFEGEALRAGVDTSTAGPQIDQALQNVQAGGGMPGSAPPGSAQTPNDKFWSSVDALNQQALKNGG